MASRQKSVLFVQPYLPRYRVAFFQRLVEEARRENLKVDVCAGLPHGEQAQRQDAADAHGQDWPWLFLRRSRQLSISTVKFTHYSSLTLQANYDAVVAPAAASCADSVYGFARRHVNRNTKLGLWGHFAAYVKPPNKLDLYAESLMNRRADRLFSYTQAGADFLVSSGVPGSKIVVFNNTIDTDELESERIALRDQDSPGELHPLTDPDLPAVCYFGGLDASKNIAFLAAVLDVLYRRDHQIRFFVGGTGSGQSLLDSAVAREQVILLGPVGPRMKAEMAARSVAIVNPGRIGLVAVDALTLGIPIVASADYVGHAPEYGYLQEGESLLTLSSDPQDFASELYALCVRGRQEWRWAYPRIGDMVSATIDGLSSMLGVDGTDHSPIPT